MILFKSSYSGQSKTIQKFSKRVLSVAIKRSRYNVDTKPNPLSSLSCDSFIILFFSENVQSHYFSLTCYPSVKWTILSRKRSLIFYATSRFWKSLKKFQWLIIVLLHRGWMALHDNYFLYKFKNSSIDVRLSKSSENEVKKFVNLLSFTFIIFSIYNIQKIFHSIKNTNFI